MNAVIKQIAIEGATITLHKGSYAVAGRTVEVKQDASFTIEPADKVHVQNESVLLSEKAPESWHSGTRLAGPRATDVNARGSLAADSLHLTQTPDGAPLDPQVDYLLAPEYAMVGLAPGSRLDPGTPVYASYDYGLLRLDSIEADAAGNLNLLKGTPHIACPKPPALTPGAVRLLNIFRPYHSTNVSEDDIFPVLESPEQAVTKTTRGRIPRTLEKIRKGYSVRVVCLGDSVTSGGNASRWDRIYVEQFRSRLMARFAFPADGYVFPGAINVLNESYGGSCSAQWLNMAPFVDYFKTNPEAAMGDAGTRVDFRRILALKPDLVTIEFVNDAPFDRDTLEKLYGRIVQELQAIGAEVILITPHFTSLEMMGADSLRTAEVRPYVAFLFDFAERNHLAVADASSRWAHLWKEGIPYATLLDNTINHPDDRGHAYFAEELMRCFE